MIFDIETVGADYGEYHPQSDTITIYLATMWQDYRQRNGLMEEHLIWLVIDTIVHEKIHKCIDECLEGAKPDEVDDHKIFNSLRVW